MCTVCVNEIDAFINEDWNVILGYLLFFQWRSIVVGNFLDYVAPYLEILGKIEKNNIFLC